MLPTCRNVCFIGRIAAGEGRFNTNSEVIINTEVKSIPVTKKGVYFAFRDQGACISLLAIKVDIFKFVSQML
jgi:ephrin-B